MAVGLFFCSLVAEEFDWRPALPGWDYEFPRDHGDHADFKTEWWYFTGNLRSGDGREFGYQLTFFRQGILAPGEAADATSRFVTRSVKFAHFAVSDLGRERFFHRQFLERGAFGEAGFGEGDRLAWIDACELRLLPDGGFVLKGEDAEKAADLVLAPAKAPAVHGEGGVSQKADGEGRASHYYSITRLETSGTVRIGGEEFEVTGLSWFDHEWATNQLAADQTGWDWFSLQFDDGTELMLFQIRTADGGRDRWSGGTFVDAGGRAARIANDGFLLEPVEWWESPASGAKYPVGWKLAVPGIGLDVAVRARMKNQELVLDPVSYWEGAVVTEGRRGGRGMQGAGYLEMTGYAGRIVGLQAGENENEEEED